MSVKFFRKYLCRIYLFCHLQSSTLSTFCLFLSYLYCMNLVCMHMRACLVISIPVSPMHVNVENSNEISGEFVFSSRKTNLSVNQTCGSCWIRVFLIEYEYKSKRSDPDISVISFEMSDPNFFGSVFSLSRFEFCILCFRRQLKIRFPFLSYISVRLMENI